MPLSFSFGSYGAPQSSLRKKLLKHFTVPSGKIATASRQFPITARIDIQTSLEELLKKHGDPALLGIVSPNPHEPPSLAQTLSGPNHFGIDAGPLQHDELDIGEALPVRCLKNGLWLSRCNGLPFAILMAPGGRFGLRSGVQVEIAVPTSEHGAQFSQELFRDLELLVSKGSTYRGRVISLEAYIDPMGGGSLVKVHRLNKVDRQDLILPPQILATLERNVSGFIKARDELRKLHFQARKGILFYGPPGTGKTYTIHYLASQLPNHTTLLVTAEQIILLGEYFRLARFLQPSMMVIEDVDLIGRQRSQMRDGGEELLLNQLLNEMDGLREDAEILFILTTNRPDQIEPALASRPGRIDQAIEFPLPDEDGRVRLAKLYSRGLDVTPDLLNLMVRRTEGVSAAFIKELMRRCAQFELERSAAATLSSQSLDAALEEMLIAGGTLNRRLLGG